MKVRRANARSPVPSFIVEGSEVPRRTLLPREYCQEDTHRIPRFWITGQRSSSRGEKAFIFGVMKTQCDLFFPSPEFSTDKIDQRPDRCNWIHPFAT
uniref:Uncharacterized protein n=1 Tax=Candidatus Kentrum sp. LFY TaxID=2126342 RepID=A0A450USX4_9GAMM|nr:MAG: hypothetical protein BECKLFY1418A_GA0070994_105112 [Candidatus Kentron sp. LFY]